MSFQEFASRLFGGRDKFEEKVRDARKTKRSEKRVEEFKENFSGDPIEKGEKIKELTVDKETRKSKRQLSKAERIFEESQKSEIVGFTDKNAFGKTPRSGKDFDEVPVVGEKRAENQKKLEVDQSLGSIITFDKNGFEEFESSGPELSESKEEKAENIMESRSERAQRTDRRNAAPIAGSFEEWKSEPSETDIPGIDTLGSGDDFDEMF